MMNDHECQDNKFRFYTVSKRMNKGFNEEYCRDQFWQMCEECIQTKSIKAEKVKMLL